MVRQISPNSSLLDLEYRVATLERQVAALAEATRLLVAAVEGTPLDPPDDDGTAPAARRAHELLLLAPAHTDTP